jgi:magnesium-protoporphyrin O-methyltransferase
MAECCSARGYDTVFTEKVASRDARRYRRRGLDENSRRLVGFAVRHGVDGATVLDVGGGVGTLGLELLKAGAARAVTVELSPAYDGPALELAREAGFGDRVERRVVDFAQADGLPEADVVVMHRVVCCYPDGEGLVEAAGSRAQRVLAFSYPRRTWWTVGGERIMNAFLRLRRTDFRGFVHRPERLLGAAEDRGLRLEQLHEGPLWHIAGFARPS